MKNTLIDWNNKDGIGYSVRVNELKGSDERFEPSFKIGNQSFTLQGLSTHEEAEWYIDMLKKAFEKIPESGMTENEKKMAEIIALHIVRENHLCDMIKRMIDTHDIAADIKETALSLI
jgi:hypothetical protein